MAESILTSLGIIAVASIFAGANVYMVCDVVSAVWRRYISWR